MHKGCFGACFAMILVSGFALAAPAPELAKTPHQQVQLTVPESVQVDLGRIADALESASTRSPSSTDERNATAQESVAYWTPRVLAVAAVETLVTFAGIVLVGFTLYHTKRAADAAHAAVNEAKAAREVNRDIGEAQTRAYVKIDWAAFSLDTRGGPTSIYPVIRIEATNSGNSPAAAFRWNVRAMYTHSQGFSGTIYQNHIRHPESWGIALASRDTVGQYEPCRYAYLRDEQKAEIGHLPGVDAYFEIEIVYTDVFEKEFSIISVFGGSIGSLSQGEQRLKRLPHTLEEISRKHIEMY